MQGLKLCGFVLVDKPAGLSSFSATRAVRKALGARRAGHAGTLDPMATGLLPIAVGPATRLLEYVVNGDKEYEVAVMLGASTETLDRDGRVVGRAAVPELDEAKLTGTLQGFVGAIEQTPPSYSAIKRDGVPMYRLARRGEAPDLGPREVQIRWIELLGIESPRIRLRLRCGKGTYVRSLARDIARMLGTLGYVDELRRTMSLPFSVQQASPLDSAIVEMNAGRLDGLLLPAVDALPASWPRLSVDEGLARMLTSGVRLTEEQTAGIIGEAPASDRFALVDDSGDLLAVLGTINEAGSTAPRLGPVKVLSASQ